MSPELEPEDYAAVTEHMSGAAAATWNRHPSALVSFTRWAKHQDVLATNPARQNDLMTADRPTEAACPRRYRRSLRRCQSRRSSSKGNQRMRRQLSVLISLILVLVSVGALPAGAAQEFRVLQLNLCHSGVNTSCFNGAATIQEANAVITARQPHVLSLNEICKNDLPVLAPAMGNGFSTFAPARRPDGTPVRCTNGDEYGNGLIFRSPTPGTVFSGQYAIQDSGTEKRVYVCAEFADLVGCSTHLSTTGSVAMAQCKAAIALLHGRTTAGKPVILAGDFNLKYAPLFGPNVQECNQAPFFRKGDGSVQHVFAANLGFVRTEVAGMRYTDHPALHVVLSR
ncbi:endonuclease/exonuclease/phosphatase family protein [Nonomuraea sp. LPB2021202275-12-8]|uniref:endonuclease/exonuclease/phosphatase family protein n=1 Tax=Nonomuraea sp. LPB2021202275-12-8 TaxID=3120159 RepID=UPI00300C0812